MQKDDFKNVKRWVISRKRALVRAIQEGTMTLDDLDALGISLEEFLGWQRLLTTHGEGALRVTRIQQYRNTREPA